MPEYMTTYCRVKVYQHSPPLSADAYIKLPRNNKKPIVRHDRGTQADDKHTE